MSIKRYILPIVWLVWKASEGRQEMRQYRDGAPRLCQLGMQTNETRWKVSTVKSGLLLSFTQLLNC
jgi:hypothetical protein